MRLSTYNRLLLILTAMFTLHSCDSGYRFEKGQWVWISYDEGVGRRVEKLDSVDINTFNVLKEEDYAKDKNHVYYKDDIIKKADPMTFEVMKEGYSKDKYRVFLDWDIVIFAKPNTFKILDFPYSKDKNDVYCGTIPLKLSRREVNEFKVTNTDSLMATGKTTSLLSFFIESNPDYVWIDTLNVDGVIYGEWATGETKSRKFKGFREVKEK